MKFELTSLECYSFALVLSMKSLDRTVANAAFSRVCVIFPGALGDFVCFLPTLQNLLRSAQVDLYARSEFAEIVPAGVTVRSVESAEVSRLFVAGAFEDGQLEDCFSEYEAVYSWMGSQQPEFVNQLQWVCQGRAKIFPFRPVGTIMHQADYYLRCVSKQKFSASAPTILPRAEAVAWRKIFSTKHALSQRRILIVAPGSGAREKNWPEEFFLAVAEWWHERMGGVAVLLLGPAEQESGGVDRLRQHCLVAGGLSLAQAVALLDASDAFLGNDSGITHLAAALGVPTVALFGPSDPRQWAPRGKTVSVVSRAIDCSPCTSVMMKSCPHRACLTDLYPENVTELIARLVTQGESRYLDKVGVRD